MYNQEYIITRVSNLQYPRRHCVQSNVTSGVLHVRKWHQTKSAPQLVIDRLFFVVISGTNHACRHFSNVIADVWGLKNMDIGVTAADSRHICA